MIYSFFYSSPADTPDKMEGISVNELMQYGYLELRYIIDWAKKVPGEKQEQYLAHSSLFPHSMF